MKNTGRLLRMASNHLTKQLDDFAQNFNLTWNQMTLIDYLSRCQPCTQKEIETEFTIQRSTATVMIQRMEKKGLIERQVSPTDSRQRVVLLTDKATPLISEVHKFMINQQKQMEKYFSESEIDNFEKMLRFFINDSYRYENKEKEVK
ncbi:MarR family winged helix-turn-helix transcriptional regulator [Ligilactobacillus cholophilus]|uniref:MarR family winged helix-turn-helix transcriptional regulator n=1 Tax=Ligilactobacillus cholophilus TaxID=3050131 RepID=UPI0025B1BD09|nr:MarR family winged helix-turn-helix transcriptional regulator [Ligilactobacillus cholophilus]